MCQKNRPFDTLFDLDRIDVEFLADLGWAALAPAVRTFEAERLFFEQLAALFAAQLRLNITKFKGGALAEGAFCYDAEIGPDGFSDVTGVVTDDHVDFEDTGSAVFTAVFVRDLYDFLCDG